jgi:pyruvate ferredoxin oxidoreductase beta subunit
MPDIISQGHSLCAGCGVGIALNLIGKAAPKNVIVSMATSCLEVCTTVYPKTAFNVPVIHAAFETSSAVASGIEAAVSKLGKDWKVMAIAGDGGTVDIGLQALSGMLERGHRVTQIMVNNEAYMNTGIQRSGATPYGAWTTTSPPGRLTVGKEQWRKPIEEIVAAHRIPYVATASVAYPPDLIAKVKKAFERQPSFLDIHCPCPTGWKFDVSKTVDVAKKAVDTGMWVLYEIEDGQFRITKRIPQRKPVEEYLQSQGRFKHLKEAAISDIQKHIDSEWERLEKLAARDAKQE